MGEYIDKPGLISRAIFAGLMDELLRIDPARFPDPDDLREARKQAALILLDAVIEAKGNGRR